MSPEAPLVKCPECFGGNIEPRGENWFCHDCNLTFEVAAGQLPEPERPAPKRPRRPPK